METSKAYFEDFLQRFDTELRGRTLFQFCRDEGADYKSLMAYKRSMEPKGKGRKKTAEPQIGTDMEEPEELIELSVIEDLDPKGAPTQWQVVSLSVLSRSTCAREGTSWQPSSASSSARIRATERRNWTHSGSYDAAKNIAFMYSLYESCLMNDVSFGPYIEEVLDRIMTGDNNYRDMLPNRIFLSKEKKDAA